MYNLIFDGNKTIETRKKDILKKAKIKKGMVIVIAHKSPGREFMLYEVGDTIIYKNESEFQRDEKYH